jgi:hypothetical protein
MPIEIKITISPVHPLATEDNIWKFVDKQDVLDIEDIEVRGGLGNTGAYFSITPCNFLDVDDTTEERLKVAINEFYDSLDDPFNDPVMVTYDSDISTIINHILNKPYVPPSAVGFAIDRLLDAKRKGLSDYSIRTTKGKT